MIQVVGSDAGSRFIPLGIGKSVVIDLPRDVKDVLVADPKIANAVIRSARRAYIIGAASARPTSSSSTPRASRSPASTSRSRATSTACAPPSSRRCRNADIQIEGVGDGVVLTGTVASPIEAQHAFDIAARLVGDGNKVVNDITMHGRDQVMLKVTVAEVQRDVIKQLGIDLNGSVGYGTTVVNFNNSNPFSAHSGRPLVAAAPSPAPSSRSAPRLRAMERAGVIRTLAEPNLTAISGETATFLAGGEFPMPGGLCAAIPTHARRSARSRSQFKKFGVGLNFTPVVLAEGRISLKVMTEVSELSTENSLTLTQQVGAGQTSR